MADSRLIATVTLRPAQSYSVLTTPGRRLHFHGGNAEIVTEPDLQYVLGMPNASIRPEERYHEHVALAIRNRPELKPAMADIDYGGRVMSSADYSAYWDATPVLDAMIAADEEALGTWNPPATWQDPMLDLVTDEPVFAAIAAAALTEAVHDPLRRRRSAKE